MMEHSQTDVCETSFGTTQTAEEPSLLTLQNRTSEGTLDTMIADLNLLAVCCKELNVQSPSKLHLTLALCSISEREAALDRAIFNTERNIRYQQKVHDDLKKRCDERLKEAENTPALFASNLALEHADSFDEDEGKENAEITNSQKNIEELRKVLEFRGYTDELDLVTLEKLEKIVEDLQNEKTKTAREIQEKYHGLPPNLKEARDIVARKKEELEGFQF